MFDAADAFLKSTQVSRVPLKRRAKTQRQPKNRWPHTLGKIEWWRPRPRRHPLRRQYRLIRL